MKRAEKEVVISNLSERLKKASTVILAEYRGLKVSEITEIRREIKKNEGDFKVVKNRLSKRAIMGSEWAPLEGHFKGPVGIVTSAGDPVALTKILTKYADNFPALKLKAGLMSGKLLDVKGITALSKLPSKEELYAKLLGTLQAPASGLVRVLQAVPQKMVMALKAISEKKQ